MPKLGKKQSVLKKSISKKRKVLKGFQKQAKKASNPTKEHTKNITFVVDNVVSEIIPPPTVPASSQNLACAVDASSSDESILDDLETAQGYRLVSMESLRNKSL